MSYVRGGVMEQEKPMVCTDKDFGRFYVALKLNPINEQVRDFA